MRTTLNSPTGNRSRRLGLAMSLLLGLAPFLLAADGRGPVKTDYYKGKVVPLAGVLAKQGVQLDPDAAPHWLALAGDDGKVYPLVKTDGGRLFHLDPRLLNRPMRLTARLLPQTQLLQVVAVHSYVKGELHEVYYWCDVCSIRRGENRICECCGGPMELREEPVKK